MRLLVVEDEADLAAAVSEHLRAAGHAVDVADTLDTASAAGRAASYALVLLDLQLPDGEGLELLRDMRDRGDNTPVLIVTARDRITQRIIGLDAGADDYLVKPYDLDEMLARVTAILRRIDGDRRFDRRFGALRILPLDRIAELDGQVVTLTRSEWAILDRLSRRPGATVSRADLEEVVYAFGEEIESNAIAAHVSRLRGKLGPSSVQTVRGLGYRMGEA